MSWSLTYRDFDPDRERVREALTTLGNGRFATRGATLCARPDGVHYPGTYLAGGYDRAVTEISGRMIENEDLVNLPNWLPFLIAVEGEEWLRVDRDLAGDYAQVLDMKDGVLSRSYTLDGGKGRLVRVRERRIVSMADPDLAAVEVRVIPDGWTGTMLCRSVIDGRIENAGVARYAELEGRHFEITRVSHEEGRIGILCCRTLQSRLDVAMAIRTTLEGASGQRRQVNADGKIGDDLLLDLKDGQEAVFTKTIALATSRDPAIASPLQGAKEAIVRAGAFPALLGRHKAAWNEIWRDFDTELTDGHGEEQEHLRVNTFHLCQTLSPHTAELDVGAPARGWHGEAYRGHVFWDEVFIFRVLNLRAPRLTRALLRYRLRRLPAAKKAAREAGFEGAMFPWQSGSDGREETQKIHLNPRSGNWLSDDTHRQRHIGLGIGYNVWSYFRSTGDTEFLAEGGAELLIEIARFFASLAEKDEDGRWHIRGVMGPDEFQTAYPGQRGGIDDNAYTNVLCAWMMTRTVEALEMLPSARRRCLVRLLKIENEEIIRWQELSERLYVPFLEGGLIAQFEGYADLEELDWDRYRTRYGDIGRLDRILEAEGRDPNAVKVAKQADTLMLLYLFTAEELTQTMEQLGYAFDPKTIPDHVAYYDARTSHGSTLSSVVRSWVLARSDRSRSWTLFGEALRVDVDDVQSGTTGEGIHLGAMCGTIDILQSGYVGLDARSGVLHVDPVLPPPLTEVRTRLRYLGQDIEVMVTPDSVTLTAGNGSSQPVNVSYRGKQRLVPPGSATTFRLVRPVARRRACEPSEVDQGRSSAKKRS